MNDIVSIRYMRPRGESWGAGAGVVRAFWIGAPAALDADSGDFLRDGNLLSVAAGRVSEIDSKIGLHEFVSSRTRVVAENQVILRRVGKRRRHGCIHFLIGCVSR